ncbi:cytochrome P450 [Mycena floridula]|nr:cytochrome P450 [Mycena floridula]
MESLSSLITTRKDLAVITFCAGVVITILLATRQGWKRKGMPLPPGPKGKWLVGNAFEFPRLHTWNKFTEWRDKYGDIVYAEAFGKPIIVLNTLEAVNDLLDKRASHYTNRPELVVVGELMHITQGMPMQKYGAGWKKQRRLANQALSIAAVKKYHTLQSEITAMYLESLVKDPKDYAGQLRLATGRIVMNITYGLSAKTPDSLYITEAEECLDMVNRGSMPGENTGAYLVDLVPILKHLPTWFPGATFHKAGREGYHKIQRLIRRPFDYVKKQMAAGTARPSLALDCLENFEALNESAANEEEKDHVVRWTAGVMYAAGGESTYSTIMNFILACLYHPEVLKRAQAEIDSVVGSGRLPTLQDRSQLTFINACVKEALRWRTALPVSIARQSDEADEYRGYFIPKESIIVPNVWAIAQDTISGIPSDDFNPERHMPEHVKNVATDPGRYAFGFGRRVCPGRFLGENSVFLLLSGIVATMDIEKEVDIKGEKITPNPEYSGGLVAHPVPFPCRITPRNKAVATMLRDVVANIEASDQASY